MASRSSAVLLVREMTTIYIYMKSKPAVSYLIWVLPSYCFSGGFSGAFGTDGTPWGQQLHYNSGVMRVAFPVSQSKPGKTAYSAMGDILGWSNIVGMVALNCYALYLLFTHRPSISREGDYYNIQSDSIYNSGVKQGKGVSII